MTLPLTHVSAPHRRARKLAFVFGPLLAFSLAASTALAGTLQLRDGASLFSPDDQTRLKSDAARRPFDVRILTTTDYADQDALNRYVASQLSEGNMVVIGLDPTHRRTSVHFGTGTRIANTEFPAIEQAGNSAFRQGNWHSGVDAILNQATSAVGTGAARGTERSPTRAADRAPAERSSGFPFGSVLMLGLLLLGGIGLVTWLMRRRSAAASASPWTGRGAPGGPLGGPPPGTPGYGGAGYGGPGGYPPAGGGMGPMGGGLIGAGLGGLAGYELGRAMEHNDESHHHGESGGAPIAPADDHSNQGDNGSWDAGGGSSDWDAGSGGGGGDFGGGGDGGGSSDW